MADEVDPDPPPPPPEEVVVTTPTPTPEPMGPKPDSTPLIPPPEEGCFSKRTCLEKCFIVIIIIITILCLAFAALFIVWYFFSKPPIETCLSEDCVTAGSRLRSFMDDSVNPCNNFYEYACGGWTKKETLNDNEKLVSPITKISDANKVHIKQLLTGRPLANDTDFKNKPRSFYQACMDTAILERQGIDPFLKLYGEVGSIPTLDSKWNESKFDLKDSLVKLIKLGAMPLFKIGVDRDVKDSKRNRIIVEDASLEFDKKTYEKGRDSPKVEHFEIWMSETLEMLGADTNTTERDVAAVIDLQIEIAKLMRFEKEKADENNLDNEMTIGSLDKEYPWLNTWYDFFKSYAPEADLDSGVFVIITEPTFLTKLGVLIEKTPKRVVANYIMYPLLKYAYFLAPKFVDIHDQMKKAIYNTEPKSRWERCAAETVEMFPDFISRMYIDKFFNKEAKSYLTKMVNDLMTAFLQLLDQNPWMTPETKVKVKSKISKMVPKIAFPDYLLDDKKLNHMYESISAKKTEYMQSIIDFTNFKVKNNIKQYLIPKDKSRWEDIYPITVQAIYKRFDNEIILPAAFLREPFFDMGYSSSMNYGSIGSIIGHEITHAVDEIGRLFNPDGQKKKWWNAGDIETYKYQSECFIDQYGCYKWDGHSIDGERTLGENIADNGGLKQAFTAYRNLIRRQGLEEQRLPGVADMNHNQIFFLSFGQAYCNKVREEHKAEVVKGSHTPQKYRVYGAIQNSEDFAEAFKCRKGSRMNPFNKCILW